MSPGAKLTRFHFTPQVPKNTHQQTAQSFTWRSSSWGSYFCDHSCLRSLQCYSHVTHTSLARKRTGDAKIGYSARRLRKTLRRFPAGAKKCPEKCLVDLGRDTRTSTQSRRLVRRKGASWCLNWPSGANLLAHMQLICIFLCLCDYCLLAFLCFRESFN